MKILHIIDSGGLYGAEVVLLNLVTEQIRQGMEPVIASMGDLCCGVKPLEAEARSRGLRVEAFRMRPGPNFAGAFKILRFAWHEGVDILHSHGYKGNILFGLIPKRIRRLPIVSTLHGWTWTGGWDRMRIYEWLDRLSLRFIDRVVVVNKAMCEKVRIKKLHVVNNGIPIDDDGISGSPAEEKSQIDTEIVAFCKDGFTIGTIGRLSPEKGFDILLDALKEVIETNPQVRLIILGEGGERRVLEAQIKRLELEGRVLMPGYVANAGRYLSLFRLFALSSLTEGLPIVILEAMRAGVPIVTTSVGGIPEVLEMGIAGILTESGSCKALTKGITECIDSTTTAGQRAERAKLRLSEHYSSRTMAEKYWEIYRMVD